jgi:hypothetical protein
LKGVFGGEVGRPGITCDVRIAGGVNGNRVGVIPVTSSEIGGVDQGGAGRVELGDEGVTGPCKRPLIGILSGEVGGIGIACDVRIAGGVDGNGTGEIIVASSEIGGVD